MKIVLIKTVPSIGPVGTVKDVNNGYAVNYLIPQRIAVPATNKNVERANKMIKEKTPVTAKVKVDRSKLAKALQGFTLGLNGKADKTGTLFAGITRDVIAKGLLEKGMAVKNKQVALLEPIKKAGRYQVGINVDAGMKVMITVQVNAL